MKFFITTIVSVTFIGVPLLAQDKPSAPSDIPPDDSWTRVLRDQSERGTLRDAYQMVRGDSGKWNDDPKLLHTAPLSRKPAKMSLDDWYDRLARTRRLTLTSADDNWLLIKTEQLDDNDRVWVERIERRGKQFTVTMHQAIWQGRYQKTFTYYSVFGVNLGKLAPGKYEAKLIIKPLVFKQFEGNGRPRDEQRQDNWSRDEQPTGTSSIELSLDFSIDAE